LICKRFPAPLSGKEGVDLDARLAQICFVGLRQIVAAYLFVSEEHPHTGQELDGAR
jgi:hypothetical protein